MSSVVNSTRSLAANLPGARLDSSALRHRLARGFFWSLVGTVLSRGLSLLATIFVARALGKTGMGQLGMVQSTVGIFSAFAGLGMGLTATKYVAEFRHQHPARAGAILSLSARVTWLSGAALAALAFALAPWFADRLLAAPRLASQLRLGSLLLLFGAVNGAQNGALAGFEAFKTIAKINLLGGLANFPLMVAGAACWGLTGATGGLVAALAVNCLLAHLGLRHEAARAGVPLRAPLTAPDRHILWRFSLPAMLSSLAYGPANWACGVLLVHRPQGYAEMGVYNAASSWFNAVVFLPGVLAQVVLPLLAAHAGEPRSSRSLLVLSAKANALVVIPLVLLASLASPFIMSWYGPGFGEGWSTMVLLLLAAGALSVQNPLVHWIVASGRMWAVFFMTLAWAVAMIAAAWALVPWGSRGLAAARLVAYLLNATWVFGFGLPWLRQSNAAQN